MRNVINLTTLPYQDNVTKFIYSLLRNPYLWVILISFTIRLATLNDYPIGDTTEARYSEISRKILETGNWVTLRYLNGEPFWGKPPLLFWLQAISFKLFGINEFSARLPSIFISLLIVNLVFYFAKIQLGKSQAWIASTLLSTNVLFLILSGSVIPEPLLLLSTTLSMIAFWQTINDRGKYWGYLFFIGLAIGLLSMGPFAAVVIAMPVIAWLIMHDDWRYQLQRFPLFTGTLLMLVISLPWYLMAEHATPGFLNYYIIGEHLNRYITQDWPGNMYGSTHSSFTGAIWLYWLAATFPMSLILLIALLTLIKRKKSKTVQILREDFSLYLILWIFTLIFFFTFTRNATMSYVFIIIPATSMLATKLWHIKSEQNDINNKRARKSISFIALSGVLFPLIFLATILFYMPSVADRNSEKFLIEDYKKMNNGGDERLFYLYDRPASALFYSHGKADVIYSERKIIPIIKQESKIFLAIPVSYLSHVSKDTMQCLVQLEQFGRNILFEGNKQKCNTIALSAAK